MILFQLNLSKVKPIHKHILQIKNRSKVISIEYVVLHEWSTHLINYDILVLNDMVTNQDTMLIALWLVDRFIKRIVQQPSLIDIYIDLSKAFDTLNHDVILENFNTFWKQIQLNTNIYWNTSSYFTWQLIPLRSCSIGKYSFKKMMLHNSYL